MRIAQSSCRLRKTTSSRDPPQCAAQHSEKKGVTFVVSKSRRWRDGDSRAYCNVRHRTDPPSERAETGIECSLRDTAKSPFIPDSRCAGSLVQQSLNFEFIPLKRGPPMLYTIALILVVLWLLGLVTSYTLGGFIHLLIVIAVIVVLLRIISGRKVV